MLILGEYHCCFKCLTGWWFQTWLLLSISYMGIIFPTDFHIFQRDWNHQPANNGVIIVSHWLSYFSEGLKPPTSGFMSNNRIIMLVCLITMWFPLPFFFPRWLRVSIHPDHDLAEFHDQKCRNSHMPRVCSGKLILCELEITVFNVYMSSINGPFSMDFTMGYLMFILRRMVHSPTSAILIYLSCPLPCNFLGQLQLQFCSKAYLEKAWSHVPSTKSHWICFGSSVISNTVWIYTAYISYQYKLERFSASKQRQSRIKPHMWAFHCSSGDVRPLNFQWYVVVASDIFGTNDCYFCCAQLGPKNPHQKPNWHPAVHLLFWSCIMGLKSQRQKEARKESSRSFVLSCRVFGWQGCVTN